MTRNREKIIAKCKEKLIDLKYRYQMTLATPPTSEKESCEVVDMAIREQEVQNSQFFRGRMRSILPEIYLALQRIDDKTYGLCEETGEEIESNRLLAVPWTRLSMRAYEQNAS